MYAHSGSIWRTACQARNRAAAAVEENSETWPEDTIVAIVLAAAATEAFINELAESIAIHRDSPYRPSDSISAQTRACADALQEIEESRGSLTLKYLIASQTLSGSTFEKGTNPYQDFVTLIKLRNDLMHLRPQDSFLDPKEGMPGLILEPPKYIKALQQRGLARTPPHGKGGISWFNLLQTREMAAWACETAQNIILAVMDFIPEGPVPALDPAWMFRDMFKKQQKA